MAYLGLADAVDASEALFEAVGVPWQVVVDHEVGVLEIDAFPRGIGGHQDQHGGVETERLLGLAAVVAVDPTMDDDDGLSVAQLILDALLEVIERVAVFGE